MPCMLDQVLIVMKIVGLNASTTWSVPTLGSQQIRFPGLPVAGSTRC